MAKNSIDPRFLDALQVIMESLSGVPANWVITGSLGMALQGLPVEVHDIDLQSDREGAYQVEAALSEFVTEPLHDARSEKIWPDLGRLKVLGVSVDLMGGVRKRSETGWGEPVNLTHVKHYVKMGDDWLPVLSIAYEAEAYARMGRAEKAEMLRRWAEQHPEDRVERITNYLEISPDLGTGGQPLPGQIGALGNAGYQAMINLARTDQPSSLREEGDLARAAGMDYVSIPVIWEAPGRADLERFYAAMDARRGQKVFVHCVLNFRVSSFVYLYRANRLGVDRETARRDLLRAWTPNARWEQFISDNQ